MSSSLSEFGPIQRVIDAIVDAINARRTKLNKPELPSFRCYLDRNESDIRALSKHLASQSNSNGEKVLLISTPQTDEERRLCQPWHTLLKSIIRETDAGLAPASLESLIPELKAYLQQDRFLPNDTYVAADDLVIQPRAVPTNQKEIQAECGQLLAWAWMEQYSGIDHQVIFSHLAGGLRPLVVVFDDYNNYIERDNKDGSFTALDNLPEKAKQSYGNDIERLLKSHCKNLNNLSAFCEVQTHKLWIGENPESLAAEVAGTLPFERLAAQRDQIGAFLIDLEWKPTLWANGADGRDLAENDWSKMGYRALRLLSLCFPEIPCFVYTGHWSEERLQDALANGARWCFYKESHHGYSASARYQITSLELEQHLSKAAESMYGAFIESPFPEQLLLKPGEAATTSLITRLGLRLPVGRDPVWQGLRRILATLFPNGDELRIVKVFATGRSKAQAAFVVRPFQAGIACASRFLKVAPWLEIQREFLAYQRTIRPRVNSHVANIVDPPVLVGGVRGEMPLGMLVYSIAGLPEDYDNLKPLDELIRNDCFTASLGPQTRELLRETLNQVLWPFYGRDTEVTVLQKPLWSWLGEVLPPAFTGVLVPVTKTVEDDVYTVGSWRNQGFKDSMTWLLAGRDTDKIKALAQAKDSTTGNTKGTQVKLSGFHLLEIEWGGGRDTGEITLAHPDLGWRVRLRGRADDIRRRFGAMWERPGLPIDVVAVVDKENLEFGKIRQKLQSAIDRIGISGEKSSEENLLAAISGSKDELPDPFKYFAGGAHIPNSFSFSARQSPIHGDLNLHNILFSGKSGPGWLIDFERAVPRGMTAFDMAKLEAEIWHHHLFLLIERLAAAAPGKRNRACVALLNASLTALDGGSNCEALFASLVRTRRIFAGTTDDLLRPVARLLGTVAMIRAFASERLKLTRREMSLALAAYFFAATKFSAGEQPWRAIFSFYTSAIHLQEAAPSAIEAIKMEQILERLRDGGKDSVDERELDGLLISLSELSKSPRSNIDEITASMGKLPEGRSIAWPESTQRWDLASTGSITNITPLFGYLWLMVKAGESKHNGEYSVMVPKISSSGNSGGTVDILESGGLHFPTDPDVIVETCKRNGGILCRQDKSLTPVDKVLMARRKKTNTMKNAALVYASVLSKKIAMGCTHAIVDVKVGRDGKLFIPDMGDEEVGAFVTAVASDKLLQDNAKNRFAALLKRMGVNGVEEEVDLPWISQKCSPTGQSMLQEVRWFFTNADMPQCRSVGRQITLLHLDDLIMETYGENLLKTSIEYQKLYRELLPRICDINNEVDVDKWRTLQTQWRRLKSSLPLWKEFTAEPLFRELKVYRTPPSDSQSGLTFLAPQNFEKGLKLSIDDNLRIVTFAAGPYQPSAKENSAVKRIDAWRLDALFDWLCGSDTHDPEVGIYLHYMPGESVSSLQEMPFVSVCYRPARTHDMEVVHRFRQFLSEGVEFQNNNLT